MSKTRRKLPTHEEIKLFRETLLRWFKKNKRSYPWRDIRDPFRILVAEMMLRRTKADQVARVYERFISEYPTLESLAEAEEQELEKLLYPLGLSWRIPSFRVVAREIKEKHGGRIPDSRDELKKLPGVGDYVAGAVLSLGYGQREWMVDTNVVRVLKRYFGITTSKEGRRDKGIIEIAKLYVSCDDPRAANLAILDFAALICSPVNPKCEECPLKRSCKYSL